MTSIRKGTIDTTSAPKAERIEFWESESSAQMIGLKCVTTEEEGLRARFDYTDLGGLAVYDIRGNSHIICRSAETVRKFEKDAVFLCFVLEGEVFVNRQQRLVTLNPGDAVLYDANTPYIHGFSSHARQLVFEVAGAQFRSRFPSWILREAFSFRGESLNGALIGQAARGLFKDICNGLHRQDTAAMQANFWSLLEMSSDLVFNDGGLSTYHLAVIRRTRAHVQTHIAQPVLDTQAVADAIGLSPRQLNRILAQQGLSVKKLIVSARLQRARDIVRSSDGEAVSVSELAWRCGFSSPANFSRCFKQHFGTAPRDSASVSRGR